MKDFNDFAIGLETVFRTNENAFTYKAILLLLLLVKLFLVVETTVFVMSVLSVLDIMDEVIEVLNSATQQRIEDLFRRRFLLLILKHDSSYLLPKPEPKTLSS